MRFRSLFFFVLFGFLGGVIGGAAVGLYTVSNTPSFLSKWLSPSTSAVTSVSNDAADRLIEESEATNVVTAATASVVSIVVSQNVQTSTQSPFGLDPFFDDFFDTPTVPDDESNAESVEVGSGTGFVVSADGYIATNRHVVGEDEHSTYRVIFEDGSSYDAELIDKDSLTDFAILRIDAKDLHPLELGDSDALQTGQTVIAIGNTLGEYDNTVTKGIVSGLSRNLGGNYSGLIQTDAAINRGNSGGPLLNLAGQVVGINTAVDRAGEGIGFAIPINEAKVAIQSVQEKGRIVRPALGVLYVPIDQEIAELNELPYEYGAYIRGSEKQFGVVAGSAADKAGIKEGDILLEVDGVRIDEEHSLPSLVSKRSIGDVVVVKLYRDKQEQEVQVTLDELPKKKTEKENVSKE